MKMNIDLKIRKDEILINDTCCWICGMRFDAVNIVKTMHHTLPKHLKPQRNAVVPICEKCHEDINKVDSGAVQAMVGKMLASMKQVKYMTMHVLSRLKFSDKNDDKANVKR